MAVTTVTVPLGDRSYEILLGNNLLVELPGILQDRLPTHRYAIITDSSVGELYGPSVLQQLGGEPRCALFSFPAGEQQKTRDTWAAVTDQMLGAGFGRDSAIVALGGGVTGDVAGFIAATFMRGIPFVQVPTSLLAMIDSSVGGKTGVDTPYGKNLVGAFHQPAAVVVDVSTLSTLPDTQLRSGLAEAVKHGAIADAHYLEWLVAQHGTILARDAAALLHAVRRSVEIKAGVVAADETERGKRAILNFGHTVGHALEAVTGYRLLHGEAIAVGMLAEGKLGIELGLTDAAALEGLRAAVQAFSLPERIPRDVTSGEVFDAMEQDKKKRLGTVRFALIERLGKVARGPAGEWTHTASRAATVAALKSVM